MKRVLLYGDSNTWGYIGGSGKRFDEDTRWPCLVQKLLGEDYCLIDNGINGRTTVYDRPWSDHRNGAAGLGYALLSQMPLDLVVVMLGTNDLGMMPMGFVVKGMDELTRQIVHANDIFHCGPNTIFRDTPRVLLIAPTPFGEVTDTLVNEPECGKRGESLRFAAEYKAIAEKYGIDFMDAGLYAETSEIDGVHFTPAGHRAFAEALAEKLKEILG